MDLCINTIHKHLLVLLTIFTTVWGNPSIERLTPTADQSLIQKNSLKKESWSKKKIAGLAAAAIFTSSIIAIKGKDHEAQPTQETLPTQGSQQQFAVTRREEVLPDIPIINDGDELQDILKFKTTRMGFLTDYKTPQLIIGSVNDLFKHTVKDILIIAHHEKYNWKKVFRIGYPSIRWGIFKIYPINDTGNPSQDHQTCYSTALVNNENKDLASVLFYLGHSFLIRPVKGSPVPRKVFHAKSTLFTIQPDNTILRDHIETTHNYNFINPYRKFMPLEKDQKASIFFNIPFDVRKIIYDFLPHIHWIDITIDPQTKKFITKTDDGYDSDPTQETLPAEDWQPSLPLRVDTGLTPLQKPPVLLLMPPPAVAARNTHPCASTVFTCSNFILNFDAARFEQLLRTLEALKKSKNLPPQPQQYPLLLTAPPANPIASAQEQSPKDVLPEPLSASVFTPKKTCDSDYRIKFAPPLGDLIKFKIILDHNERFSLTVPEILIGSRSINPFRDKLIEKTLRTLTKEDLIKECKKIFYIKFPQRYRNDPVIIINQSNNTPDNKANPSTMYLLALALNDKPIADYLFNHEAAYSVVHPSKLPYKLSDKRHHLEDYTSFGINLDNEILKEHLALRTPYRTFLTKILLENNLSARSCSFRNKIIYDIGKIIFDFLVFPNGIKLINPRTYIISNL